MGAQAWRAAPPSQWVSVGVISLSRGHLAKSTDIARCQDSGWGKRPRVLRNIHSAQDPGFLQSQVAAEAETSRSDPLASSLSSCRKAAACAQRRVKDHSPSFSPRSLVLTPCLRMRGTTTPQPRACVRMGQAPGPCSTLSTGFPKGLELDRERLI